MIELSIVIPVYNEEESLSVLYQRLNSLFPELKKVTANRSLGNEIANIEILFVNDGSTDNSRMIMDSIVKTNNSYRYISLSRNFGHQAAVSAGIRAARGKAVVIIDADLQDPPELISDMIKKWRQGFDVVYAVRRKRKAPFFRNAAYKLYYRFKALISDYPVQRDSGDFSLLDRKVVDIINKLPEKDRYMRGLRAWVGFKQVDLEYDRLERKLGRSKYSFLSLAKLALQGILSTSVKPLFLSGLFCALSILVILGVIIFVLFAKIYVSAELMPRGWSSLMIIIAFLSGLQLISIWLLSLYMAKIYREIISRPTYLIEYDSLVKDNQKEKG